MSKLIPVSYLFYEVTNSQEIAVCKTLSFRSVSENNFLRILFSIVQRRMLVHNFIFSGNKTDQSRKKMLSMEDVIWSGVSFNFFAIKHRQYNTAKRMFITFFNLVSSSIMFMFYFYILF